MKRKIINSIIVILLVYIVFSSVTYFASQSQIAQWEAQTTEKAKKEAGITAVRQFYVFTKEKTYYTVEGENSEGEAIYYTYSPDNKQTYQAKADELVNAKNALALTRNNLSDVTVKNATIGIENDEYVWEVSFKDQNGALGYHYIDASDAQWYETVNNL